LRLVADMYHFVHQSYVPGRYFFGNFAPTE